MFKVYTGALGCPQILIVLLQEIKLQGAACMSLTRGLLMRSQKIPLGPGRLRTQGTNVRVRNGLGNKSRAGRGSPGPFSYPRGVVLPVTVLPPSVSGQWSVIPPREREI